MTHSGTTIPELLAPAGGRQAFEAAIANGADAVYLGLGSLNARRGAENFDLAGLEAACRFAHLRGRRVYLTANVVILPDEMDEALRLVTDAWGVGVDAVIVQDLGLLSLISEAASDVRIHASTQINAHNTSTVRTLGSLGVSRVTLARESSMAAIEALARAGAGEDIETESFVHGALCVCYSGQCLLSSLIGGRSANRGACAQPCRLAYELVDGAGEVLATPGAYLLSPRDLAGLGVLPQLVSTGVAALKIEGRMKSPEYVALVTGVYRRALDRVAADPDGYAPRDGEFDVLAEAFSRGFSSAYLTGERGNDMMSYTRPNNRGVLVGRVVAAAARSATVTLDRALSADDTLEFWTRSGRFAQRAGRIRLGHSDVTEAPAGARVELNIERQTSAGDRVFRVANAQLLSAARRTFAGDGAVAPVPLDLGVRMVVGQPLQVTVADDEGREGVATRDVVEPARTKAVTSAEAQEHVGRLGGTPYAARRWEIELSPGAGIGFSSLHAARREAIADYERRVLAPWTERAQLRAADITLDLPVSPPPGRPRLVVTALDLAVARAALEAGADEAHVPVEVLGGARAPRNLVPVFPRVAHDEEVPRLLDVAAHEPAVVVGNLGLVREAARAGARVQAHWSLNVVNPWSARLLARIGASEVWASPELNTSQLADVCLRAGLPVGAAVYGRQEVMVTEHCVLMAEGPCDRVCARCDRRSSARFLRDRKGYKFPVFTDAGGRTHLYNAVVLDLLPAYEEIRGTDLSAVRLDFVDESPDEAGETTAAWARMLAGAVPDGRGPRVRGSRGSSAASREERTTGHYFRGVR